MIKANHKECRDTWPELITNTAKAKANYILENTKKGNQNFYDLISAQLFLYSSINWLICLDKMNSKVFKSEEIFRWLADNLPYDETKSYVLWHCLRNKLAHGVYPSPFIDFNDHQKWAPIPKGTTVRVGILPNSHIKDKKSLEQIEKATRNYVFFVDELIEEFLKIANRISQKIIGLSNDEIDKMLTLQHEGVFITI